MPSKKVGYLPVPSQCLLEDCNIKKIQSLFLDFCYAQFFWDLQTFLGVYLQASVDYRPWFKNFWVITSDIFVHVIFSWLHIAVNCVKLVVKDTVTLELCSYTTLWSISTRYWTQCVCCFFCRHLFSSSGRHKLFAISDRQSMLYSWFYH